MITDFDIASDFKVEMWVPETSLNAFIVGVSLIGGNNVINGDSFIIGVSLIGGNDTLGVSGGFDWQPIESVAATAEFSLGGSIESTLYFQPEAGQLSLRLQSWDYDPSNNVSVRPGTPIRIRIDNGTTEQVLFSGFIDTFDVAYAPNEPNLITISAYDSYKRLVNARMTSYSTTGLPTAWATPNDVFEEIASETGFTVSASSDVLDGKLPKESATNVTTNQFINDAIQVGLGVVWINPENAEIVLNRRPAIVTDAPPGTWTIGNNHGDDYHLCLSEIAVGADIDNIYNSLYLTMASNDAITSSISNEESIEVWGEIAQDVTINSYNLDEMNRWANAVFDQRPSQHVTMVKTRTIDREGNLTAAAGFKPGELVGVKYVTSTINIDDYYTVTKVSHSVDVNQWYTTLELWKEF